MSNRRAFLISTTAWAGMVTVPAIAQHNNLAADTSQDEQPIRRRYMMEDTYGNMVNDTTFQGKFVLIYFGYTGCPDVCPTTLSTMADVMEELGDLNDDLAMLFITVDPKRDSAKLLREYIGFFDKRMIGLRGPKPYTDHMVKAFNARYEFYVPDPKIPEEYSVDHTASVAFVGPYGNLIKRFPHGMAAAKITADIRSIMAEAKID